MVWQHAPEQPGRYLWRDGPLSWAAIVEVAWDLEGELRTQPGAQLAARLGGEWWGPLAEPATFTVENDPKV